MANNVDPDQTPRSAASDLGLHYLLRPVCSKYLGSTVLTDYINHNLGVYLPTRFDNLLLQ